MLNENLAETETLIDKKIFIAKNLKLPERSRKKKCTDSDCQQSMSITVIIDPDVSCHQTKSYVVTRSIFVAHRLLFTQVTQLKSNVE